MTDDPAASPRRKLRLLHIFLALFIAAVLAVALAFVAGYNYYSAGLPKLDSLADYRPNIVSLVYDVKGRPMGEFRYENQRRFVIPVAQVPPLMIDAFVAVEDEHFFEHKGLDYAGIVRAAVQNLQGGTIRQGASTITQQVCRSLLLTPEKTVERKIKEAILAYRIEKRFSKEEILFLYLNQIYFGNGAYGVEAAARSYFGKSVGDLTLGEIALIAGLPQAPSRYNPITNLPAALLRRQHVLSRMEEIGKIDKATAKNAAAEELRLTPDPDLNKTVAPDFTEYVRRYMMKNYGADTVLKEGLRIETTCDLDLQAKARESLRAGLHEIARRQGWTGPQKRIAKENIAAFRETLAKQRNARPLAKDARFRALVLSIAANIALVDVGGDTLRLGAPGIEWLTQIHRPGEQPLSGPFKKIDEIVKPGDVILIRVKDTVAKSAYLDEAPTAQGAILAMNPSTREVFAMIGGYDFKDSEFNRALQARRQPGSAFKPIVYASALDAGMTVATRVMDTALVFADGWRPRNYSNKFTGELPLRQALAKSVNTVTVRVAQAVGPSYIESYAKRLGLKSLAGSDLSMALGSYEILPVELINAYAVFASGGVYAPPIFIRRVLDRDGRVIEDNSISPKEEEVPPLNNAPDLSSFQKTAQLTNQPTDSPLRSSAPSAFNSDRPADDLKDLLPPANQERAEFMDDFDLSVNMERLGAANRPRGPDRVAEAAIPKFHRDTQGRIVARRVMSRQTAFLMTSMLQSVATSGTGARANVLGRTVAGKTGTTNNNVDAWFIGFSTDILTGVWVGNDAGSKTLGQGETGSNAALPIWIDFMKTALAGTENRPFPVVQGIETVMIDPATGLRAYEDQDDAIAEYFKTGTAPTQVAPKPGEAGPNDFFQVDF